MRLRNTLRMRFALGTAGLLFIALVIFGTFVYVRLAQNLAAAVDDSLRLSAAHTIATIDITHDSLTLSDDIPTVPRSPNTHTQDVTIRMLDTHGQIIQALGPYHTQPVLAHDVARARQNQSSFTTVDLPSPRAPTRSTLR